MRSPRSASCAPTSRPKRKSATARRSPSAPDASTPTGKSWPGCGGVALFADGVDFLGRGQVVEPVEALNGSPDAEVTDRQDVGPLQGDQQKHISGPPPEPAAGRDLRPDLVVRKRVEMVDLQLAGNDMLRQRAKVFDFHP